MLVDNGRTRLIGTQAQETLRCIRCSACLNHCPIYAAVGGHAYGATYPGPIGAALNPNLLGLAQAHHHPNASTFCGRCAEVCPVKIPLPKIMRYWRAREFAAGMAPASARYGLGLWAFAAKRPGLYRFGARFGGADAENAWRETRRGESPAPAEGLVRRARSAGARGQDVSGIVGGAEMSARDDILGSIKARRASAAEKPSPYAPPAGEGDAVERFSQMAVRSAAEVRVLDNATEIPDAVADILRARNLPARVHLPEGSALADIGWSVACETTPPGPDDAAVTRAPFAIAETGTLAYPSASGEPASWHFRPGLEIAVLKAGDILPHMENVLARVKANGLPPTLNFVTGPSRTGDIEQTLELGAHGPKALVVLVVRD